VSYGDIILEQTVAATKADVCRNLKSISGAISIERGKPGSVEIAAMIADLA
jgi:hypothetical protein